MKKKNIFLIIGSILLVGLAYIGLRVVMTMISIISPFLIAVLIASLFGLYYYKSNNKKISKEEKSKETEEKHNAKK